MKMKQNKTNQNKKGTTNHHKHKFHSAKLFIYLKKQKRI